MRKLPLTMLGAMTGVGKMTGAGRAESPPLTFEQMDQITAGQLRVILTASSQLRAARKSGARERVGLALGPGIRVRHVLLHHRLRWLGQRRMSVDLP
jgi:hypothetical protein